MLRQATQDGWWLITHVDHARLAGEFAARWGSDPFISPEPRDDVLRAIRTHDDGWAERDALPEITKQGKPGAFSSELVGKYSAFEEIDLNDYLSVRRRAVKIVSEGNPYAGLLVSLHTYNLLTARADRSTIASEQLPLLDAFLEEQLNLQDELVHAIAKNPKYSENEAHHATIQNHFHLLQACDNLSLLACVDYPSRADLLHPLPIREGGYRTIEVERIGERHFRLSPFPFGNEPLTLTISGRHVASEFFASKEQLRDAFNEAAVELLCIKVE